MFALAPSGKLSVLRTGRACLRASRASSVVPESSFVSRARAARSRCRSTWAGRRRSENARTANAANAVQMGLFGLGWPEIAVIVGVGLLIWGPSRVGELGRNLGSLAGNLKRASSEFKEGLETSLAEAEKEQQSKEEVKLKGLKSADPTTASSDSKRT
ncbi:hypothetical protein CCYA_CCYA01G0119 [Cyanidiococcus yangmingshanensis]|nr:hypothetical protein CCYA_CCYA01G0119 [Cyanidiococcus yangmingshanensis]